MGHFFSTRQGRRIRDSILARDLYTCQMCKRIVTTGRTSAAAAVVDHTIPTSEWPDGERDQQNMRCVCKSCHDGPCASIETRHKGNPQAIRKAKLEWKPQRVGLDGWSV